MALSKTREVLVAAANADLSDPARNQVLRPQAGITPRFELYHAGLSMCSQKVRVVLAEKGVPYLSHEMSIVASRGIYSADFKPAENYRPSYVRLRLHGGEVLGQKFAEAHTGRSSVESEGFDACVVPLLVDHAADAVIVDSKRICAHLDRELPTPRLIPENPALARAVTAQVDIVDRTPHPGLLYGFHPDNDQRPDFIKHVMADVYDVKAEQLERLIAENADDQALVAAYRSKIAKERAGKAFARDPERQRGFRAEITAMIKALDGQLQAHAAPWICGHEFTLADAFWGISLYRLLWLGLGEHWAQLPRVGDYAQRLYARESINEDVIHWPSPMPPSPHTVGVI